MKEFDIINKVFVKNNRAYKTKQGTGVETNLPDPIEGIRVLSEKIEGEGEAVICLHPDGYKFPVARDSFFELLRKVNIENGLIKDHCILGSYAGSSFSLIKANSPEYDKKLVDLENEQKKIANKFHRKEVEVYDIVTLEKSKKEYKKYVFLGEFYTLPFQLNQTKSIMDGHKSLIAYGAVFNSKIAKKFYFAEIEEIENDIKIKNLIFLSTFPIVTKKIKGSEQDIELIIQKTHKILEAQFLGNADYTMDYNHLYLNSTERYKLNFTGDCDLGLKRDNFLKIYNSEVTVQHAYNEQKEMFGNNIRSIIRFS